MRQRSPRFRHLVLALALLGPARIAVAQSQGRAALGLTAIGLFGVSAGTATVQGGREAFELSGTIDFGHLSSRRVRVAAQVSYLRSTPFREFVEIEDSTYRAIFYDSSAEVQLTALGAEPRSRVVPYLSVGAGVHALSSSVGSTVIDQRYNGNYFGLAGSAGLRLRAGTRHAVYLEGRRIQARFVRRSSLHLGVARRFSDLR